MRNILVSAMLLCGISLFAQKNASVSFEKWISLKGVGSPVISPDGKTIVYTVTSTDWANNAYDTELWMARDGEAPIQLTRTSKAGSTSAAFTPDGKYVSFLARREEKVQLYIISIMGGEAIAVTNDADGISSYDWSPDGTRIVYSKPQTDSKIEKNTKERFGAFAVEGEEYKQNHLWVLNFNYDSVFLAGQLPCYTEKKDSVKKNTSKAPECFLLPVAKQLTEGNFSVAGFSWCPDGKEIAFNRQTNPLILSGMSADIVLVDADTKKMTTVISNPTGDFFNTWNPEGTAFVYGSQVNDSITNYFKNNRLFIYDLKTKGSIEIAKDIDENKSVAAWSKSGLFLTALEKTKRKLYSVDLKTGSTKTVQLALDLPGSFSFSKNSDAIALSGANHASLNEIYQWRLNQPLKQVSNNNAQIKDWKIGRAHV